MIVFYKSMKKSLLIESLILGIKQNHQMIILKMVVVV